MTAPRRRSIAWATFVLSFCGTTLALLGQPATSTAPSITTQPAPYKPTLMAHGTPGNAGRVWVAYVEQYKEGGKTLHKTVIRTHALPADQWEERPTVYGHAVALASLQGDLAILLEDGGWRRLGDTVSSGPLIIGGIGPVLGWASSAQALYAIRGVEGGKDALARAAASAANPATQLSTSPAIQPGAANPASRPATTKAAPAPPPTPVLFRYERGQWSPQADLPAAALGRELALTVLNNRPVIAAEISPANLRTWVLMDQGWVDWGQVKTAPNTGRFSLLATGTSAALWTIDQDGGMQLFMRSENDGWAQAKDFTVPPGIPPNTHRALTVSGEEMRLFLLKDAKLHEQRYDLTGARRGSLGDLPAARSQQPSGLLWTLQAVVLLVMILVMLVTLYRRRAAQQPRQEDQAE